MKLGVNVDHVATLRQARGGKNPDPVQAALVCQKAGAHAIVMHLREDRRHIQDEDLFRAKKALSIKLNMEMSAAPAIVKVALKVRPDQVTLVPEKRQERTTESGLDLLHKTKRIASAIEALHRKKISVSLFIDPVFAQLKMAKKLGVKAVEFHTGTYAEETSNAGATREFERIREAAFLAEAMGITVHAGHGLDYQNVKRFKELKMMNELNIGYSIISRAVWVGLDRAVTEMLALIKR